MDAKFHEEEINIDEFMKTVNKMEIRVPAELDCKIRERVKGIKKESHIFRHVIACCISFCLIFVLGVKFSPTFASYVVNIPVLGDAAKWLQGDSGIENAKENGYNSLPAIAIEEDGYVLTLDSIFLDEDRLRFSAVVSGPRIDALGENPSQMEAIVDQKGTVMQEASKGHNPYISVILPDFKEPRVSQRFMGYKSGFVGIEVEMPFKPGEVQEFLSQSPQYLQVSAKVYEGNEWMHEFKIIKIPLQSFKLQASRVLDQELQISMDHTKIELKQLTLSPTRMKLDMHIKMEDGYEFTGFENACFKDDKGKIYKPEGLISTAWDEGNTSLYFVPSLYFEKLPKKLYFCFDGIRIASKEGKTFTLHLNDAYPKTIHYMGQDITVESLSKVSGGMLRLSLLPPDEKILRIQSIRIPGLSEISWSDGTRYEGEKQVKFMEFYYKIETKDAYQFEFEYPGYYIPNDTEYQLNLK